MKVSLPRDERCPQLRLIVTVPGEKTCRMSFDDSHHEAEVPDAATRVEAHLCDALGRPDERRAPVILVDVEPPKVEPPKVEPPKVEPPKVELPKVELPKVEPPKVEPPKYQKKSEPPKVEQPSMEPKSKE